jgi:two-component system response regulator NreC
MHLTEREQQVLELIIKDELSSAEISVRLGIAIGTVDTHRKKLLAKFQTSNSVGLTKKAIQQKIIVL